MKPMIIFIAGSVIQMSRNLRIKMVAIEGAEAGYATASGMSAVFGSFMALLKSGDHLLSCRALFGSTHNIITKYLSNMVLNTAILMHQRNIDEWKKNIRPNTKMIYVRKSNKSWIRNS
jgi:O-succinylhomoserine sulfhydrylase